MQLKQPNIILSFIYIVKVTSEALKISSLPFVSTLLGTWQMLVNGRSCVCSSVTVQSHITSSEPYKIMFVPL